MDRCLVLAFSLVLINVWINPVASVNQEEILERLRRQEARTDELEKSFRSIVIALTAANKVLEKDTMFRSILEQMPASHAPDIEETDAESKKAPKSADTTHHQPVEISHVVENAMIETLTLPTESWRSEIERVNRQLNDVYEVVGQWEKELQMQNETMARLEMRLQESLADLSSNLLEPSKPEVVKDSINHLRGALMCSLTHLIDFDYPDYFSFDRYLEGESPVLGTSSIEVTLGDDGSMTVQWELTSTKCHQYLTGIWIRVYEPDLSSKSTAPYFKIPKDCLKRISNVFSFAMPSASKSFDLCYFPLNLVECREHAIEIIPNYFGLRGKALVSRFKSSPQSLGSSTSLKSLGFSVAQRSMSLNWTVNSEDCDRQLDSVRLKISDEKKEESLVTFTINSQCFAKTSANTAEFSSANPFTTSLSPTHQYDDCRYQWTPLAKCQKYQLELEPIYWSGSWNERRQQKGPSASMVVFTSETVPECCNRLTDPWGFLSSPHLPASSNGSHRCFWWITAEPNNNVWLTLKQLKIHGPGEYLKVYDGPYYNSPLLLSLTEGAKSHVSVRSKARELFIEMNLNSDDQQFQAVYTSVENEGVPFVAGCGGYIHGHGIIRSPYYSDRDPGEIECVWYVESESPQHTILLDNLDAKSDAKIPAYSMTVSDGWTVTGKNFDENGFIKPNIYSLRGKARIEFQSNTGHERSYAWRVSSVSTPL